MAGGKASKGKIAVIIRLGELRMPFEADRDARQYLLVGPGNIPGNPALLCIQAV